MKKIYKKAKQKNHNKVSGYNKFKKKLRFNSQKGIKKFYRSREEILDLMRFKKHDYKKVIAPANLSLLNNPEETIFFINELEKSYLQNEKIFVELKDIKSLDHSAVTLLLSILFSFKTRNIEFDGSFPKDKSLALMLINSDFFKYLRKSIPEKLEYAVGKENQIFTRANKEVNSELGYLVMAEAGKTICGEPKTYKGLQRTLLELMQNTNNHADKNEKGEKHWWLSINHNKNEKKVSFVFVDYGIGIFESLKYKPNESKWAGWAEKIKNKLTIGGNDEIFRLLLNGQMHMTVTGHHFRGKGLPGIKEVLDRNQISDLKIISNNVFADVVGDDYLRLVNQFSGTFVYWELNTKNINSKWVA